MGVGHPDHKIRGAVLKIFFSPFRASVWSRSKWGQVWGGGGGGGSVPPGPTPGFATAHGLSYIASILLAHVKIMRQ